MRKQNALRLLSILLAVLTMTGVFVVHAGAEGAPDDDTYNLNDIGGLTDILSTVKYADYLKRYDPIVAEAVKQNGLGPDDTVRINVVSDYDPSITSVLCRKSYVDSVIRSRETLSKFFDDANARFTIGSGDNRREFSLIDVLCDLDSYRNTGKKLSASAPEHAIILNGTPVTSVRIPAEYYTEFASRLLNPRDYFEKYPEKYPTLNLNPEEQKQLDQLEIIRNFLSDISQKYVDTYDAASIPAEYADTAAKPEGMIYLPDHDAVGFRFHVDKTGYYTINLRYFSVYEEEISKKTSIERSIYIDGAIPFYEATYVGISKTYENYVEKKDENGVKTRAERSDIQLQGGFPTDINGNEIRPSTEIVERWRSISLMDSTGSFVEPLKFYLTEGDHTLQLFARREPMVVSSIMFIPEQSLLSYRQYLEKYKDKNDVSADTVKAAAAEWNATLKEHGAKESAYEEENFIKLEAEYPEATSDNTIYPTNDRTSCITSPQHPSIQYLNTLGGSGSGDQKKWSVVGQWVRYKVTVPEDGFYKIAVKFSQSTLQGSFVSRQLRVQLHSELGNPEGATVPFAEAYYLQFNYGDEWQIGYLNDGTTEFSIYLEKGDNIVEFEANLGGMSDIIRRVTESLNRINDAYIKFLMLAGSSPDANRDYGFFRRIPDAVYTLSEEARRLYSIAKEIEEITGTRGSHVATLEKVAQLLERMGKDESEIAGNLNSLKSNLGTLGTWISNSKESPLEIDYLLVAPGNKEEASGKTEQLPDAVPGFFKTMWFEIRMFGASFSTDYNTLGLMEETDESAIVVWTTTGRDQANIIRSMVNNDFTTNTEIAVNLKLVAGGSLLPSVLAGVGPDVSMGHGSSDVINWAIRSALVEVTDFGTKEYCAEHGYAYDQAFDAQYITGFANVVREFRNEQQDETDASNASFSTAAMVPITLHEVITKQSYDEMDDAKKKAYDEYDVKYYFDVTPEEYDKVEKYLKKYYAAIKDEAGHTVSYRYYISAKDYNELPASEQGKYKRNPTEYYEKFSLWGLPQEQSFNMMFYRADIFNELGIEPPKTWDDLYAIIGVLQSNNMEIAMPGSLGGFEMFLYQMGGDLYSNGGQTISLDENLSIEAFETMCNFFQQYKFPIAYDFSNRFRSGEIPMGILGYTAYTQLQLFATEIKGMWEFVPLPGIKDSQTGAIHNQSTSGSSAIIMLKGAADREVTYNAWKFMVWFTGRTAQSTYASEVTAVLGTESKHPTANKDALKELPWTSAERDNLLAQFDNLVGIPEYPGGYIISRYVNFAFLDVYNNNADPVTAIQEYVVTINSELTRKRQEFELAYKDISYSNS
ncbi:MAG: extracellular solute-binding protein [Clostridia bacterium]|nr:extracellular solute-binding protein [Clostridia bacterium]